MLKKILILCILTTMSYAVLSDKQMKLAERIYKIAKTAPNIYGETYEETLLKIAITESSLGVNLLGDYIEGTDITDASLGIFQFRMDTIRHLQRVYKEDLGWLKNRSDRWIAQKLLNDEDFNIIMAIFNIHRLSESKLSRHNYFRLVSRWNGGLWNRPYYTRVQSYKPLVKKIIIEFKD